MRFPPSTKIKNKMISAPEIRKIEKQLLRNEKEIEGLIAKIGELGFQLRHDNSTTEIQKLRQKMEICKKQKNGIEIQSQQLVEMIAEG